MNETATQGVDLEGSSETVPGPDSLEERSRQSKEAFDAAGRGDEEADLSEEERASLDEQRRQAEEEDGEEEGEDTVAGGKGVKADAQTALDETVLEDEDLLKILTDREVAKGKAGEAKKKYATLDSLAKEKIDELMDEGDVVRIGQFRVRKTKVPSRSVSFETQPTTRLSIGVAEE